MQLDARNIEAAPDLFLNALERALTIPADQTWLSFLAAQTNHLVLLIDTIELLTPIDGWLRDDFLPQLPSQVLVVMAGRNPPAPAWRIDPGWQTMMRVLPLRNLNSQETRDFLLRRQIPAAEHEAVLNFTHGHPLALSLVADGYAQLPGVRFQPEHAPDVIKTLLGHFIEKVPGPAHRAALEICALVRLTTEPMLAAVLETDNASELFAWLRGLSFIDADRHGLFPHDLAREALTADLRWRNPEWYATLHNRVRTYYLARMQRGGKSEQRRIVSHYMFLHRDHSIMRAYVEWQISGSVFIDALRPQDQPALLEMVRTHEGEVATQIANHWLTHPATSIHVLRHATGGPQGFLLIVALDKIEPVDRALDPAVQATWSYLQQQAPLRPGETATLFRFWMAQETYQAISPSQSRLFLLMVQHYMSTAGIVYTFLPFADPEFWAAICAYVNLQRLPAADFTVEGRRYGVFGREWRTLSPMAWLAAISDRELGIETTKRESSTSAALPVLNEQEFAAAVRDALHDFTNPNALQQNPLLKTRLVVQQTNSNSNAISRVNCLKQLLQAAAAPLQTSPRQASFYRVLQQTYFQPAATQEQAAELLDLPFSTYRRHLRSGIEFVTAWLWQREVGAGE